MKKIINFTLVISLAVLCNSCSEEAIDVYEEEQSEANENVLLKRGQGTNVVFPAHETKDIDPKSILFQWEEVLFDNNMKAVNYTIHVKPVNSNSEGIVVKCPSNSFKLGMSANTLKLLFDKSYYWYVVAEDAYNRKKNTPIRYFRTAKEIKKITSISMSGITYNTFDAFLSGAYHRTIVNINGLIPNFVYNLKKITIVNGEHTVIRESITVTANEYGRISHSYRGPLKIFDQYVLSVPGVSDLEFVLYDLPHDN